MMNDYTLRSGQAYATQDEAERAHTRRARILATLDTFVNSRPGLDPRNYISHGRDEEGRRAYRQESRSITRDLHDYRILRAQVELSGMDADAILKAAPRAYAGRLEIVETETGHRVSYCTGQYYPTEYRRASCAVLATALWDYYREPEDTGDSIRAKFRRMFGRRIQRRWFD